MADHPNAAIIRQAARQMEESGNLTSQIDLIDDNVVWHEIGSDEPIRGKAAARRSASPACPRGRR